MWVPGRQFDLCSPGRGAFNETVKIREFHERYRGSFSNSNSFCHPTVPHPNAPLFFFLFPNNHELQVWIVQSPEMDPLPVLELFDMETPVQALAIDGTGKALVAAGEDGMVAVWDTTSGALLAT